MDGIRCEFKTGCEGLPLHFHKNHEIIFIKKGSVLLFINGIRHSAGDFDIVLLSDTDSHSLEVLSGCYERYVLTVPSVMTEKLGNVSFVMANRSGKVLTGSADMESDFRRIIDEQEFGDEYSDNITLSCIYNLISSVCRKNPELAEKSVKERRVYDVKKYIDENFRSDIKLSEICDRFFISRYHLTHSFSETMGCSPKNYIMRLRLNNAGRILKHASVSEAAFESGFSDVNNFIRSFRENFGITPGEYKKRHLSK